MGFAMTTPWWKYILYLAAFGGFGWLVGYVFFNPEMRQFRKWLALGLLVAVVLVAVLSRSPWGYFFAFVIGVILGAFLFRKVVERKERKREKSTAFGSAEWATVDELRRGQLVGANGLRLGGFTERIHSETQTEEPSHALRYAGDRHLLTVAPTRSGKGASAIIPNLLTYVGSAVVIDPKGENAMITAARRGKGDSGRSINGLGQSVHVVDPWGITGLPVGG
jgi:type IV secretion system protein VirD4